MVAIVEEIEADRSKAVFMDLLGTGHTIELGTKGRLVLGYLNSCLREVIDGGTVTIGREKSTVKGGKIKRERVECDGGACCCRRNKQEKARRWYFEREIFRKVVVRNNRRLGFIVCNR